jgi:hypothetical protein
MVILPLDIKENKNMKRVSLILMFFVGMFLSTLSYGQSVVQLKNINEDNKVFVVDVLFEREVFSVGHEYLSKVFEVITNWEKCGGKMITKYEDFIYYMVHEDFIVTAKYYCNDVLKIRVYRFEKNDDGSFNLRNIEEY